ncbi:MAG TPA: hypothetical protein VFS59_15885 [Gemmatimonadaceae bacterium]|nr:hypothetical protein [Gemmatimonadaceae bacterium]
MRHTRLRLLGVALALLVASSAAAQVPARLADSTFWRLMHEYSEPWGTFRSENFVSNETSLQYVIPELTRRIAPGGVYLGVAPDQNFTYIAAVRPSIAFIVDIRHQNAMQHLMYKTLFETSRTRAEFLATLFARAPLEGVDTASTATALFDALAKQPSDSARYRDNLRAILARLTDVHRFALNDSQRVSLGCVYGAFFTQGPDLTYNYASECRNPGAFGYGIGGGVVGPGPGGGMGRFGFRMPTYQGMITETDSAGVNWSYLGSEARFRAVKEMQERNLIVPLTGNFAGPRALRAVGDWARARGATVTTFYVSNVEQYLFQQGDEAQRFYENVASLPIDSTSTFVRSFAGGRFVSADTFFTLKPQSPNGRSLQLTSSIAETLAAFRHGTLTSWMAVIGVSRQ